jgi:hypothetical protein
MILFDSAKADETVRPFKEEIVKREERGPSTAELLKVSGEMKKEDPR